MSDRISRFGLIFVLLTVNGSCDEGESGFRRFLSQRLQFGVEFPEDRQCLCFGDAEQLVRVSTAEVIVPVDSQHRLVAVSLRDGRKPVKAALPLRLTERFS